MTTLKLFVREDVLARALAELDAGLRKCDYRAGPPPWLRVEALDVDRETCADGTCDRCGHAGMACHPYHRPGVRRAYRAYAVCPGCGDWSEF
jgi:hypothetical protein